MTLSKKERNDIKERISDEQENIKVYQRMKFGNLSKLEKDNANEEIRDSRFNIKYARTILREDRLAKKFDTSIDRHGNKQMHNPMNSLSHISSYTKKLKSVFGGKGKRR